MQKNELKNIEELYKISFPQDSPNFVQHFLTHRLPQMRRHLLYNGERLVCMFFLSHRGLRIFQEQLQIDFLTAAATHPTFRGMGVFPSFFLEQAQQLYNKGTPFIFLHPFDHAYYTRLDFVTIDYKPHYSIQCLQQLQHKCLDSHNKHIVKQLFDTYAQGFDIAQTRNEQQFQSRFLDCTCDGNDYLRIFEQDNAPCGYAIMDDNNIEEAVLLSSQPSTKLVPNTQARIINALAALRIFAKYLPHNMCFELHDSNIRLNQNTYTIHNGHVTTGGTPTFSLTIADLCKLLLGTHHLDQTLQEFSHLFPPRSVFFCDMY